ncbi:MAG: LysR family transcriptional regulator [Rhodobacteraceae bacterium]|nr:LysR family transcriptional regulator [Paracoccaceae bacterium]
MLDKLEMFIAVAREEHFGRAAVGLGITQPTLSAGIKQLEDQLGVQLIFRGSRYGGLTPEGQNALEWARRIVGDARQLKEEMRFKRHGLAGQLRIAVIPTALTWAAKLSAQFSRKHPRVRMTLLSHASSEILSMIEDFSVDAGISYLDNEPVGKFSTAPLYREHYMLVCRSDAPMAARDRVGWHDLDGEKLCLLTPDMQNRRIINQHFLAAGVTPRAGIESNSTVVLIANVEDGDWMTVLPADMARFLCAGKPLCMIPVGDAEAHKTVGLVAPWREPHTPVLKALLTEAGRVSDLSR